LVPAGPGEPVLVQLVKSAAAMSAIMIFFMFFVLLFEVKKYTCAILVPIIS
jgi:hypothetical protein